MLWGELTEITHIKHLLQCFPHLRVFKLLDIFSWPWNFLYLIFKSHHLLTDSKNCIMEQSTQGVSSWKCQGKCNQQFYCLVFMISKELVEFIFYSMNYLALLEKESQTTWVQPKTLLKLSLTSILTFLFELMNSSQHFFFCFCPLYSVGRQYSLKSPEKRKLHGWRQKHPTEKC